jgi:hypothetical protein
VRANAVVHTAASVWRVFARGLTRPRIPLSTLTLAPLGRRAKGRIVFGLFGDLEARTSWRAQKRRESSVTRANYHIKIY